MTAPAPHPFYLHTVARHILAATPPRPVLNVWPVIRLLGAVLFFGLALGWAIAWSFHP